MPGLLSDNSRRSAQSNPQFLDRPPMGTPSTSDSMLRNGQPQSRPQPPPIQHLPFPYPPPNGPPQSASQPAIGAILSPQPRMPANMQNMQSPGADWSMERPPPVQDPNRPSSRPSSYVNSSRTSSESPHPYQQNGQQQHPQLQQR